MKEIISRLGFYECVIEEAKDRTFSSVKPSDSSTTYNVTANKL
jgi:hypothetical protein